MTILVGEAAALKYRRSGGLRAYKAAPPLRERRSQL